MWMRKKINFSGKTEFHHKGTEDEMSNARKESRPVVSYRVKLKNRRVTGGLLADGTVYWVFRRLTKERTVEQSTIRLSREAIAAMFEICVRFAMWEADQEKRRTK